jgi:hypothetical protein
MDARSMAARLVSSSACGSHAAIERSDSTKAVTPTSRLLEHRNPALRPGPGTLGAYSSGPTHRLTDG